MRIKPAPITENTLFVLGKSIKFSKENQITMTRKGAEVKSLFALFHRFRNVYLVKIQNTDVSVRNSVVVRNNSEVPFVSSKPRRYRHPLGDADGGVPIGFSRENFKIPREVFHIEEIPIHTISVKVICV